MFIACLQQIGHRLHKYCKFEIPRRQTVIKNESKLVDLRAQHVFPPIVSCTAPVWGAPKKGKRKGEPIGASASCQRSTAHQLIPAETSADCADPAESHRGEGPQIKADKLASTCERNIKLNI